MGITEGISVTIAQHNGGTPSFEQLWASDSESPKLDIYYREGISDLERRLEKWLQESSAQFDLQATGEDYTLRLNVSRSWPKRLEGLLKNKVQDYLVHTVTAGWLNDFDGITVKQDYQSMAAQDLDDIVYIVGLKSFGFAEQARAEEEGKSITDDTPCANERGTEKEKETDSSSVTTTERSSDDSKRGAEALPSTSRQNDTVMAYADHTGTASERTGDDVTQTPQAEPQAASRTTDTERQGEDVRQTDGRHDGGDTVSEGSAPAAAGSRQTDNDTVVILRDWCDWSGTHVLPFGIDACHAAGRMRDGN